MEGILEQTANLITSSGRSPTEPVHFLNPQANRSACTSSFLEQTDRRRQHATRIVTPDNADDKNDGTSWPRSETAKAVLMARSETGQSELSGWLGRRPAKASCRDGSVGDRPKRVVEMARSETGQSGLSRWLGRRPAKAGCRDGSVGDRPKRLSRWLGRRPANASSGGPFEQPAANHLHRCQSWQPLSFVPREPVSCSAVPPFYPLGRQLTCPAADSQPAS